MTKVFTTILHGEEDLYVAECSEVGTVSKVTRLRKPSPHCAKQQNFICKSFR